MVSEQKKANIRFSTIVGAVLGVVIFGIAYTMNPNLTYLLFIPFAAAMGWGIAYVKDDNTYD
jgi:membrane protease YdiL (CAAX protease family)